MNRLTPARARGARGGSRGSAAATPSRFPSLLAGMPRSLLSLLPVPARAGAAALLGPRRRRCSGRCPAPSAPARADTIEVKSAELRAEEGEYFLNAEFDFTLNATLEEALQKGVPLYFLLEFEIFAPRGTGSTRRSLTSTRSTALSYNALTRQYRVRAACSGRRSIRWTRSSGSCPG